MSIIAGNQVRPLQNKTNAGGHGVFEIGINVVTTLEPGVIGGHIFKHLRCEGVPNTHIGIGDGLGIAGIKTLFKDVFVGQHQQKVFEVRLRAAQPVLEAEHEVAGILGFFDGQVFKDGGQGAQELEHRVLEAGTGVFFALAHELSDGALGLTQLSHRKTAQLV